VIGCVPPSEPTIRRTVKDINADEADALIGGWLFERVRAGRLAAEKAPAFIGLALDGKTLKGAWPEVNTGVGKVRLFSALVHGEGVIVGQRAIPADTSEVTQVLPLLDTIAATGAEPTNRGGCENEHQVSEHDPPDLGGAVITADAVGVHRDNIEGVLKRGGEYVLTVKSNQPKLRAKLTELFDDPDGAFPPHHITFDRGHSRCETRDITCTANVVDPDFPGVFQAFRIRRVTTDLHGNPNEPRPPTAFPA
jgi:hypothetical protein